MTDNSRSMEYSTENIPDLLPILPLFDAALFPKMVLPLVVMQEDSIKLIDEAMAKDRIIGLIVSNKKENAPPDPKGNDLADVGTSALILKMAKTQDNKTQLLVQGLSRFKVSSFEKKKPYLIAKVIHLKDGEEKNKEIEALMSNMTKQFARIIELSPGLPSEIGAMANSIKEPGTLSDMVASTINTTTEDRQKVLDTLDVTKRLKIVTRLVNHQVDILELGNKIQSQVKGDMDKRQREYYLRQQLKAIKDELGETDESSVEID